MKKKDSGFTLMELVVVIATVSVLALLPLTALALTKSESRRINCVGNLKRVGLSFHLWAANHGDRYPMRVTYADGGPAGFGASTMQQSANAAPLYNVFAVMSNELTTPKILLCPSENYSTKLTIPSTNFSVYVSAGQQNRATSYFIGADADATYPSMFLTGDHNIGNGGPAQFAATVYPSAFQALGGNVVLASVAAWTELNHQKEGNVGISDASVQQFTTAKMREALRNSGDPAANLQGTYNRVAFPR